MGGPVLTGQGDVGRSEGSVGVLSSPKNLYTHIGEKNS